MRILHHAVMAMLIAGSVAGTAQAQSTFPNRPVRIVVGFSPGSATDMSARMIAPKLSELWKQAVIVENRSGAGSSVASAMVAKATPDGHTLLLVSSAFAINAVMQENPPYDALRDFASISQIGYTAGVMVVTPTLGVKSVKELIAVAQERPGKILFGSAGAGSGIHITAERFRMTAGIKTVHVGFKGQPEMLIEILAGRIHYGMPSLGTALSMIKDGRLLALAMLTPQRSPLLPDVPAMAEVLPGFERDASHALLAPAGTPRAILHQISKDVARVLDMPDVKQQMQLINFTPAPTTPEEYDKILRSLMETMAKVVRAAGLRAQ